VPEWRNGRRRGFKIPRREACRFESGLGYHLVFGKAFRKKLIMTIGENIVFAGSIVFFYVRLLMPRTVRRPSVS
jgi:hypothetical protein